MSDRVQDIIEHLRPHHKERSTNWLREAALQLAAALESATKRLEKAEAVCEQLMVTPSENFIDTATMDALRKWHRQSKETP